MKSIACILVLAVAVAAQEAKPKADKRLEQAEKLEKQAARLLDDGKRKEAFDALAKAAELRRQAEGGATTDGPKPGVQAAPKAAADQPEADQPKKAAPKAGKRTDEVETAHAALDEALRAGDMKAAQAASARLREARTRQAKRVAALEKRLRAMEKQLAEIRELIGAKDAR